MIDIGATRIIDDPPRFEWSDQRPFMSADAEWTALFADPFEWHMGATGWKLRLLHRSRNVSLWHPWPWFVKTARGYDLPLQYVPWSSSGHVLALLPWKDPRPPLCLYRPDTRRGTRHQLASFPFGVQWAPAGIRLAITSADRVDVLDDKGETIVSLPLAHVDLEVPRVFWWRDGRHLLVVGRESRETRTMLRVFDAQDGALRDAVDFDPAGLLPYDQAAFAMVERDRYTLLTAPGVQTVGSFLDTWSRVEFDAESGLLRAFVYRPFGPARRKDGELVCPAVERAVEVTVTGL